MSQQRTASQQAVLRAAADLGADIMALTIGWPPDDAYALQARLRRAILAIPGHLVAAYTQERAEAFRAYVREAISDAKELAELLGTALNLDRISPAEHRRLDAASVDLIKSLYAFLRDCAPVGEGPPEEA